MNCLKCFNLSRVNGLQNLCSPFFALRLYGLVRSCMVLYCLVLSCTVCMVLYGLYGLVRSGWSRTASYGLVLSCTVCMVSYGLVWSCMVSYGLVRSGWSCMVSYGLDGLVRPCMVSYGLDGLVRSGWSRTALYGLVGSCMLPHFIYYTCYTISQILGILHSCPLLTAHYRSYSTSQILGHCK